MSNCSLYHLVQTDKWDAALADNKPYYPATYDQDGFIHLTADPELLLDVANRFYTDVSGEWETAHQKLFRSVTAAHQVLVIDQGKVTSEVKFEAAAPVGDKPAVDSDEPKWPHLYGTIDFGSVERRWPVHRDASGRFQEIVQT